MKFLLISIVLCFSLFYGADARARIFFGDYDKKNLYKYHVELQQITPDSPKPTHLCGGAIIHKRYVLTAANCVYQLKSKDVIVRTGHEDAESGINTIAYHKVTKIMYPRSYSNASCRSHDNDIAMLKIVRSFDLADEDRYQKVYLPEYDVDYEYSPVMFTSFGPEKFEVIVNKSTNATRSTLKNPKQLKYLESTVLPLEECKNLVSVAVSNNNICTNPDESSGFSCMGDTGGPLVHEKVIVGIRNRQDECSDDQPELFTRVSSYLPFINSILNYKYSYDIVYVH